MPPKDLKQTQFYMETESGEHIPFSGLPEIKLEPEDEPNEEYMEYFKGGEFEIELTEEAKKQLAELINPVLKVLGNMGEILKRTFLCNNWRKMHGLPLIRRRGNMVKYFSYPRSNNWINCPYPHETEKEINQYAEKNNLEVICVS